MGPPGDRGRGGMIALIFISAEYRATGSLKGIFSRRDGSRTVTYCVAKTDLPTMTILDAGSIERRETLLSDAPELIRGSAEDDYFTHSEDLETRILNVDMLKGMPIMRENLVEERLDVQLDECERAVVLPVDNYAALKGKIHVGSHVDVIATYCEQGSGAGGPPVTETVLQGKEVLSIRESQSAKPNDARPARSR